MAGIGISRPRPLNPATGILFSAGNLPGWENVPLANLLQETFHVPAYLRNDANVAVVAEPVWRRARLPQRDLPDDQHPGSAVGPSPTADCCWARRA